MMLPYPRARAFAWDKLSDVLYAVANASAEAARACRERSGRAWRDYANLEALRRVVREVDEEARRYCGVDRGRFEA